MKYKNVIFCRFVVLLLICSLGFLGCTKQNDQEMRMAFHGSDSGRNSDIGMYVSLVSADFITSRLVAIDVSDTKMEDENLKAMVAMKVNVSDNQLIFAKNIYDRIYPASTTKLMTALLVLKYANLSEIATVERDNAGITVPGAKLCGFLAGDSISMETLLNCLMVYSGNDAGIIMAEHLFGTEDIFVEKMNEEAALIGATATHFVNSHGLHNEDHYTTGYDMYLIFMECLKYENFLPMLKKANYEAVYNNKEGQTVVKNYEATNLFLLGTLSVSDDVIVYGGKTGSTKDAGDCLILFSERTDEDGNSKKYITEVFKASSKDSLYEQMAYLLEKKE